jgi:multidrug efflux pump subunit AcrA (membrane-fusion protein)
MSHIKDETAGPVAASAQGIDLSQLAVRRQAPQASGGRRRRQWFTRYAVPGTILAGFVGLFGWATRASFLAAHAVTVTPVVVTRAEVQQEGTPLFQAAGWIEPRPTAVDVSSLVPGIVDVLLVAEGQFVEQGQPVVKLIDTDSKLALQQAEAHMRLCEADVQNAEAAVIAARIALEKPNALKVALADAKSLLAETQLTLGNLPYTIEAAKTRRQLAAENVARKEQAGDAIAGRLLREARSELALAESGLAELQSRGPTLQSQLAALQSKCAALSEQLQLMSEQKRAVSGADAMLAAARAKAEQAQLSVDTAKLQLERMTIRAPMAGRVLSVDARPGMRLAGMDPLSQHSGAVISLYDPKSLQVRVDVRLEDVPHLQIGQPAQIETAALAKPIVGKVLWVTTRADIQKNTLQVKVAIDQPPDVITPEMLGQVTFLAPPQATKTATTQQQPLRLLVPRSLVASSEGSASLWVADTGRGVARQQNVQLGRAGTEQLVEVAGGLNPTDKLIVGGREALAEGSRIVISGEDQSLGLASGFSTASRPTTKSVVPGAAITK